MTTDGMRVVHGPREVAGIVAGSAFGLREIGVPARAFAFEHPFRYPIRPDAVPPRGRGRRVLAVARELSRCQVLHVYGATSFYTVDAVEARTLRRLGRRVVVEFVGSDIRVPSLEEARNPHFVRYPGQDDETARRRLERWSAITGGHTVVCDPALELSIQPYFPNRHYVGMRTDTRRVAPSPPRRDPHVPLVVHAPSNPLLKGTAHVRRALEELRSQGAELEYREIHGTSHAQAQAAYRDADLVVDQLCMGSHGVFAVEAMALAKPTICHILPELRRDAFPPDLPLIDATPDTLTGVLAEWLERPRDRHELGRQSREYAQREHDVRVAARRLARAYAQLPGR